MRLTERRGVPLLQFDALALDGVLHGVTTRRGGVSTGPYATLNLAFSTGDERSRVLTNRGRVSNALGVDLEEWVCARQVHGGEVALVGAGERGRGARSPAESIPGVDALATAERGVALVCFSADCPLVGVVDPAVPAAGLAHASWRSTVAGIVQRMVGTMVEAFGCRPERMRAALAPSAGPCCYEVGADVLDAARRCLPGAERFFLRRTLPGAGERLFFDLWSANLAQLVEAGVPPAAVERADVCTICRNDHYFSYRAAGGGPVGHFAFLLGIE